MGLFDEIATGPSVRTIAYTSDCLIPERIVKPEFYELAAQAYISNEIADVNSILFYDQHRFFQLIEGPDATVCALLKKIQVDTRHRKMRLLLNQETRQKDFGRITMLAYFIDGFSASNDPAHMRLKSEFKSLCSNDAICGVALIDFARTMMSAFDRYMIMR